MGRSEEVSTGHANLSQRTEQQAPTLEETARGLEELSATVKQNADNCQPRTGWRRCERLGDQGRTDGACAEQMNGESVTAPGKSRTSSR